jgi:protein phosphatase
MKLATASWSDRGPVRPINADAVRADATRGFFALADGVGSQPLSADASRFAVDAAHAAYATLPIDAELADLLPGIMQAYAERFGTIDPPATTLTVAVFRDGRCRYFNVGDSPLLLLSGGARLLTRQHTIVDRTVAMDDFSAMKSIRGSNILFNYLGDPDAFAPNYPALKIAAPTRFLLCSDGVFDVLSQDEIGALLGTAPTPDDCVRIVCDAAEQGLPSDNYSLIVIDAAP